MKLVEVCISWPGHSCMYKKKVMSYEEGKSSTSIFLVDGIVFVE